MVDRIEISQEAADKQVIPEDLNSLAVGSYIIPNPQRRKTYGFLLIITALISQFIFYFNDWLSVTAGAVLVLFTGISILFILYTIEVTQ